jgi:hypothetical protein
MEHNRRYKQITQKNNQMNKSEKDSGKDAVASAVDAIVMFFKIFFCRHEFYIDDLEKTNIPEPQKPNPNLSIGELIEAWDKYWNDYFRGEHIDKRIKCKCSKCGKTFYASSGLEIFSNGKCKGWRKT